MSGILADLSLILFCIMGWIAVRNRPRPLFRSRSRHAHLVPEDDNRN